MLPIVRSVRLTAAAIWLGVEIVLVQTAVASSWEGEPRAAAISWTAAAVLLAVGLRLWFRPS